jgi:dolichol kinase
LYDIKRKSVGDIVGPLAILAVTFVEPSRLLFVLVILHTGLADGLAALVGTRYGKKNRFKVFGTDKSVAGSLTFFMSSLVILATAIVLTQDGLLTTPFLVIVPFVTTFAELIGSYGLDNVFIIGSMLLVARLFSV